MPSTVQQHALFGTFNDVFRQMNEEDSMVASTKEKVCEILAISSVKVSLFVLFRFVGCLFLFSIFVFAITQ